MYIKLLYSLMNRSTRITMQVDVSTTIHILVGGVFTITAAAVPGLEVIKLQFSLKLKIKHNDWLLGDVSASSQSLRFILSLRMNSSFITSRPGISAFFSLYAISSTSYTRQVVFHTIVCGSNNDNAGLRLCSLQTPEDRFSLVEAHMYHICHSHLWPCNRH